MIQATVAIYPMSEASTAAIDAAIERLRAAGVVVAVRSMATELEGEMALVFAALQDAFAAAAEHGGVAMTVTVSNACPAPYRP
jgi:uncharacterized protein YqgV (UPF0045/DUF77 family)